MYIAFEGIVGSGKTTQVKKLVDYLESVIASEAWRSSKYRDSLLFSGLLTPLICRPDFIGCSHSGVWFPTVAHSSSQGQIQDLPKVIHVREPGSTPIAEDIRHLAQGKDWENETMHPLTNAYLYAAARAQTLQTVVMPALLRGDIIISDRCFLSSCAIQGGAQGLGIEKVLEVNASAIEGIIPDIVLYLDVDINVALSRTFDSSGDKFEREGKEFYEKILKGYTKCESLPIIKDKFVRIDANGDEEEVFEKIIQFLNSSITNIGH